MGKPQSRTIDLPLQYRLGTLQRLHDPAAGAEAETDDKAERRYELAFSSEEPYERWFGIEILGHKAGEFDFGWLAAGRAPLLLNHRTDQLIGVVEQASVGSDRVGRAVVRLGKGALAEEAKRDVDDGILTNVSVGYIPKSLVEVARDGDVSTYRVTDWQPLEVSLVSIPADTTVGIGRAAGEEAKTYPVAIEPLTREEVAMSDPNTTPAPAQAAPTLDTAAVRREAERMANERMAARQTDMGEILAIGEKWGLTKLAREAIAKGTTLSEFHQQVLAAKEAEMTAGGVPLTHLDMSQRQIESYSLLRAIRAAKSGDWSKAPFERECSMAVADRLDRSPNGFFVPADAFLKRELTVGVAANGGNLVGTDHRADMFIDLLRPRMLLTQMGATVMSGLVGNVDVPRLTGGAAWAWGAESADAAESDQTLDKVTLTPNQGSARTILSRRLMNQSSPSAEQMVMDDLQKVSALGIDLGGINGSGASNQPLGILNTSGIGSVAGGTNGAVPDWADIVALETEVAADNADMGALGYLTNAKVRGKLKTTAKEAGQATYVFEDGSEAGYGAMNGYRAGVSNQVPSNLTKGTAVGVCSAIIFGNFADVIIASWGVLDVQVTGNTRADGGTDIRVFQDVDVAVRHPESFAAMKDALTT